MSDFMYSCDKDKELVKKSFNYNAWLILGKNNSDRIKNFWQVFNDQVSYVKVLPHGSSTDHINLRVPGICRRIDETNNTLLIEMLGYKDAPDSYHDFILHEGPHEFCHAFADILPLIIAPETQVRNGIKYKNEMGMISERNADSGEPVGQHYYGKMFNETIMDMFTTMGLASFDPAFQDKGITADTVFNEHYENWGDAKTGYSVFTSITRCTIAAFSNNGAINYQNLINQGHGISDVNTQTKSGQKLKANDFLYGIMYNPMHIEKEFDKFMGEGSYRTLAEFLDKLFIIYQKTGNIAPLEIKKVMDCLPDYLNRKSNQYIKSGIWTQEESSLVISNFNRIWNSLQQEYDAYFTKTDISNIARRSGYNDFTGGR